MALRKEELTVEGTQCKVFKAGENPEALIVQPVDRREIEALDAQINSEIQLSDRAFVLFSFAKSSQRGNHTEGETAATALNMGL